MAGRALVGRNEIAAGTGEQQVHREDGAHGMRVVSVQERGAHTECRVRGLAQWSD